MSDVAVDEWFLTPAFFRDPYSFYSRLHEDAPVVWSSKLHAWLVCPFTDVKEGLQNSEVFGSKGRIEAAAGSLTPLEREDNSLALGCLQAMMTFRDGFDHTRIRGLANKAFTARRVASFEPQIRAIVGELLDEWPRAGQVELVESFSFQLPARVICALLGIPRERMGDIRRWANGIVNLLSAGVMTPAAARAATQTVIEASGYLNGLLEEKRADPRDDLLSAFAAFGDDDGDLRREELFALIIQLFFAGFETTEGIIGNALSILLRQPDTYAALRGDAAFATLVTEETLRWDNSVPTGRRITRRDVDIHGVRIPEGSHVVFMIGAAHRDPRRFDRPDEFAPRRTDGAHLAFGHGAHFCLGAPLARLETAIALQTIAERFPNLQRAAEPEYTSLLAVRKPTTMKLWVN